VGRFYITTPIYYVNDAPHVGHAYCTLNADAMARWHRLKGDEVKFLTGTDEHGQKVADAAEANGVSPQEWTDRYSARFRAAWDALDVSYDDYIRTTEARHTKSVQAFLTKIYDNGYIYKHTYVGLYCVSCEDYYTTEALTEGKCPVHNRPAVEMEEENWFFKLSAFEDRLLAFYDDHPDYVAPATKRNEAYSFIKGGLKDISITRKSLTWGVPVPWDTEQVFYVWYDALINYLTAIGYGVDEAEMAAWWPASNHLIGKEIIRFHCVWWPAMCMAAGIEPTHHVQVHGWLLVGGQKLSKTMAKEGGVRLTDIAPALLVDDYGVDPVRYYLCRDTALGNDGDFSLEGLIGRYNTDLANNLGNLVARVATVVHSKCDGIGPAPTATSPLADVAAETVASYAAAFDGFAPHAALEATWRLIGAANAHLETHAPWKMEPGSEVAAVLGDALEVLRLVAIMIAPVMPATAHEVWRRIGMEGTPIDHVFGDVSSWGRYEAGRAVVKGDPLFPRIKADA
jgi:methionyl-tRNA synthetase